MIKELNRLLGGFVLGVLSIHAQAASVSYFLDKSNDLPDGINYLQVTISDGAMDNIDFVVDVLTANFTSPGGNFGMDKFFFNYDNNLTVSASNIMNVDPNTWDILEDKNAGGGFGKFEFQLKGAGNRTSQLTFSINDVAGDTPSTYAMGADFLGNGNGSTEFFAAHVGDFDGQYGVTSAQFAGSTLVPVPAAVWLFGSGLIGLVGVARRKRSS
jgi:hypothetical protein